MTIDEIPSFAEFCADRRVRTLRRLLTVTASLLFFLAISLGAMLAWGWVLWLICPHVRG